MAHDFLHKKVFRPSGRVQRCLSLPFLVGLFENSLLMDAPCDGQAVFSHSPSLTSRPRLLAPDATPTVFSPTSNMVLNVWGPEFLMAPPTIVVPFAPSSKKDYSGFRRFFSMYAGFINSPATPPRIILQNPLKVFPGSREPCQSFMRSCVLGVVYAFLAIFPFLLTHLMGAASCRIRKGQPRTEPSLMLKLTG